MENIQIIHNDCLVYLKTLASNSVDCIITDPPYFIDKLDNKWSAKEINEDKKNSHIKHLPKGMKFDKKQIKHLYDYYLELSEILFDKLKPGGYFLSFSSPRLYHAIAMACDIAGFEIRDMIAWVYGSGFPKSHNIGKAVDKLQGNEREVTGQDKSGSKRNCMAGDFEGGKYDLTKGNSPYEGWGTALKPALEPITVARKPFKGTVANNVLKWGTGGINIDGCRVEPQSEKDLKELRSERPSERKGNNQVQTSGDRSNRQHITGRFPANLIHDGSDEVVGLFPDTKSGKMKQHISGGKYNVYGKMYPRDVETIGDSGSAARFFYCAKASKKDRNEGNNHPTVKPTKLMQYLVRLVTPKDGTVLDPFMGSGTTGIACKKEGFDFIGIELDEDYFEIAKARIEKLKFLNKFF